MSFTYEYPRPMVTTDCATLRMFDNKMQILLIKRGNEPFKDYWALPGGFLEMNEAGETGAMRELREETSIEASFVISSHVVDGVSRDPRGRVLSLIYYTVVSSKSDIFAGDDAQDCRWYNISELPSLACDHLEIITEVLLNLKDVLYCKNRHFKLLQQYINQYEQDCFISEIEEFLS